MRLNHPFSSPQSAVTEIVAADLDDFQIVIPTAFKSRSSWQKLLPSAQRQYGQEGWIIHQGKVIGSLNHLEIGDLTTEGNLFKPIKRLAPAVPVSFEIRSRRLLPYRVSMDAKFCYQFRDEPWVHYAVFRNVLPKFVRMYSVQSSHRRQVILKARQLLIDEAEFVAKNRDQLKKVPFYREKFNLDDA